jgi:hypothetical protein
MHNARGTERPVSTPLCNAVQPTKCDALDHHVHAYQCIPMGGHLICMLYMCTFRIRDFHAVIVFLLQNGTSGERVAT